MTGIGTTKQGVNVITDSQRGLSTALGPKVNRETIGITATLYFGQGDFLLNGSNAQACQTLRQELARMQAARVVVNGHASGEGDATFNQQLSEKRRLAVLSMLGAYGSSSFAISGEAFGASKPAASEATGSAAQVEAARKQNRRVDVYITRIPKELLPPTAPSRAPSVQEEFNRNLMRQVPPADRGTFEDVPRALLGKVWDETGAKIPLLRRVPKQWVVDKAMEGAWALLEKAFKDSGMSSEDAKKLVQVLQAGAKQKL